MDRYTETFKTWNNVAAQYEAKFMDMEIYNDSYDFFSDKIIRDSAKILDIGCGPGNITRYLLSIKSDFEILGIDIAPNMVEIAQKNNPAARFAIMDSRDIEQINSKFDAIICGFCIPYLSSEESKILIANCCKLLNDNGLIYISFVEGDPHTSGFQTNSSGNRVYFYYHQTDDLKKQLSVSCFELCKEWKVSYQNANLQLEFHTILIAQKI